MKILTITLYLLCTLSLFANELKWVDEQIEAIKPPRDGISRAMINAIKSPFLVSSAKHAPKSSSLNNKSTASKSSSNTKNTLTRQSKTLTLSAIINNSALINQKWYKLNDKIGKYTLSAINGKNVILLYKKKELLLSTASKHKKLKFKSN